MWFMSKSVNKNWIIYILNNIYYLKTTTIKPNKKQC